MYKVTEASRQTIGDRTHFWWNLRDPEGILPERNGVVVTVLNPEPTEGEILSAMGTTVQKLADQFLDEKAAKDATVAAEKAALEVEMAKQAVRDGCTKQLATKLNELVARYDEDAKAAVQASVGVDSPLVSAFEIVWRLKPEVGEPVPVEPVPEEPLEPGGDLGNGG